jgi:hypothetical protein
MTTSRSLLETLQHRYELLATFSDRRESSAINESFAITPHRDGAAAISVVIGLDGYAWLAASGGYAIEGDDPEALELGGDWVSKVVEVICDFGVLEVQATKGLLRPTFAVLAGPEFEDGRPSIEGLIVKHRWLPWRER